MKQILIQHWRELLPAAAAAVLAIGAAFYWLRQRPEDSVEIERQRRVYLNRVGRIVEGQILEIVEHAREPQAVKSSRFFGSRSAVHRPNGALKLLYYTYSISGVTYETAQDITGLEERALLGHGVVGQSASVKYDPSNPSNSILLADDWSGLH
ncbi:MAG: hypothetical protein WBC04_18570 [Candidatus Acidiferrales bacterium]